MKKHIQLLFTLPLAFLYACATHTSETEPMRTDWYAGNTAQAQVKVLELEKNNTGGDELVWLLEEGAICRANGDISKSVEAFGRAQTKIASFEAQPEISISEQAKGIAVNQSYIPYKGYNYDKIMLAAYQALNFMELKEFDRAEVELKKLENFQAQAARDNEARIEKERAAIIEAQQEKGESKYDVSKTIENPAINAKFSEIYGDGFSLNSSAYMRAKGLYVNPFAYWLAGIYFVSRPADKSDISRGADFLRLAKESLGGTNSLLDSDCADAQAYADGARKSFGSFTYLVFESGSAPIREQFRLDLPLFVLSQSLPYVGVNFPRLKSIDSHTASLTISASGASVSTQKVCDFDDIIAREFKAELPIVIAKTILSATIKAAGQYFAQNAVRGNDTAFLAVAITGALYQAFTNDADLRTWTTLPKFISIAKIATPSNGIVNIDGRNVDVDKEGVNIIVAKQNSAHAPLTLRIFNLKK